MYMSLSFSPCRYIVFFLHHPESSSSHPRQSAFAPPCLPCHTMFANLVQLSRKSEKAKGYTLPSKLDSNCCLSASSTRPLPSGPSADSVPFGWSYPCQRLLHHLQSPILRISSEWIPTSRHKKIICHIRTVLTKSIWTLLFQKSVLDFVFTPLHEFRVNNAKRRKWIEIHITSNRFSFDQFVLYSILTMRFVV